MLNFLSIHALHAGRAVLCATLVAAALAAHAADNDAAAPVPAAVEAAPTPAEQPDAGAAIPANRKKALKRSRKGGSAKGAAVAPAPGQKLTLEQVRQLLKTSRDLSGQNLSGMKLVGMNLSKCNLRGADLSGADLERADLGESDLERANLAGANLRMASLRLSGIVGVSLDKATLDGAIWIDGRICGKESTGSCR